MQSMWVWGRLLPLTETERVEIQRRDSESERNRWNRLIHKSSGEESRQFPKADSGEKDLDGRDKDKKVRPRMAVLNPKNRDRKDT